MQHNITAGQSPTCEKHKASHTELRVKTIFVQALHNPKGTYTGKRSPSLRLPLNDSAWRLKHGSAPAAHVRSDGRGVNP